MNSISDNIKSLTKKKLNRPSVLFNNKQDKINEITPERIIEIMENKRKTKEELNQLSDFLMKNERLMSILTQSSSNINKDTIIKNLSNQFEFLYSEPNAPLFRYGDTGDRFYFIIKGEVAILIPKEIQLELTHIEYLNYLLILCKYKELELLYKCLEMNKNILDLSFEFIERLIRVDEEPNIIEKLTKDDKYMNFKRSDNLENIQEKEKEGKNTKSNSISTPSKINKNYFKSTSNVSFDFNSESESPEKRSTVRRMSKRIFNKKIKGKDNILKMKVNEFCFMIENPQSKSNSVILLLQKARKLMNIGIFDTVLESVNKNKSSKMFLANVRESVNINNDDNDEDASKLLVRVFKYINVKSMKGGDLFGDIALQTTKNKRTAEIYITEPSYFLYLIKETFDETIGQIHMKILNDKLKFLNNYNLLTHYPNHLLYEHYYYFFNPIKITKNTKLISQGDNITKIYFIREGEFDITIDSTCEHLHKLDIFSDDSNSETVYHNIDNLDFKKLLTKKINFKVGKLSTGELISLECHIDKKIESNNLISGVNVICSSIDAEVFALEVNDLFKILQEYNSFTFEEKKKNSSYTIPTKSETKDSLNNNKFQLKKVYNNNNFKFTRPHNQVHREYFNLYSVKREIIISRIKNMLKLRINSYNKKIKDSIDSYTKTSKTNKITNNAFVNNSIFISKNKSISIDQGSSYSINFNLPNTVQNKISNKLSSFYPENKTISKFINKQSVTSTHHGSLNMHLPIEQILKSNKKFCNKQSLDFTQELKLESNRKVTFKEETDCIYTIQNTNETNRESVKFNKEFNLHSYNFNIDYKANENNTFEMNTINKGVLNYTNDDIKKVKELKSKVKLIFTYSRSKALSDANNCIKAKYKLMKDKQNFRKLKEEYY